MTYEQEIAELEQLRDVEALRQLRHHLTELARIAYQVEAIGQAAPTLEIEVARLKLEIGRLWQHMELVQAALPFGELVAGARKIS